MATFRAIFNIENTPDKTIDQSTRDSLYSAQALRGTKWTNYSTGRTGWSTLLDKEIIQEDLEKDRRNRGQGFLKLQIPDFDPKDAQPVNIGGRMHFPSADGTFTIIDSNLVEHMQKLEEEKRSYLESIIEKCSLSDNIAALVLGMKSVGELKEALGRGKDDKGAITDDNLKQVDAMPSAIETYDPTSITYSQAIQKLKIVCRNHMPIMDSLTNKTTVNQD